MHYDFINKYAFNFPLILDNPTRLASKLAPRVNWQDIAPNTKARLTEKIDNNDIFVEEFMRAVVRKYAVPVALGFFTRAHTGIKLFRLPEHDEKTRKSGQIRCTVLNPSHPGYDRSF